jgi:hypothetical protein
VFNAQDVENREPGPTFPWTLLITPSERAALEWIRTNTPADAIVQVEPRVRDQATWAYIPAFAERRMAAGLPIAMIPLRPYQEATDLIRDAIYRAASAEQAHLMAQALRIDFLVVGRPERTAYAAGVAQLRARSDLFAPVFENDALTVFRVAGGR